MILFPGSKINLGLHVLRKRTDGYHDIETCFYPTSWSDVLEIHLHASNPLFKTTGLHIGGDHTDNLVYKAFRYFEFDVKKAYVHIHKIVPMGAGLGGGSADAASTLCYLNKQSYFKYSDEELEKIAAELGADCAYFIRSRPVLAQGLGFDFSEISISLAGYYLLIIWPGVGMNTKMAYSGIRPKIPTITLQNLLQKPLHAWKDTLKNDFEHYIFELFPEVNDIKNAMYDSGAIYASMSGSGTAVYGLFNNAPNLLIQNLPVSYLHHLQKI